ncbi:MAG: RNA polymerase sigma factor [Marmoricola sp.]
MDPWASPGGPGAVPSPEDREADVGTALAALYAEHRVPLLRAAVLLVRDRATAEDLVQDAFADMCRRWPVLADHERAAAYLRTAVVNRARSALRHRAVVDRHRRTDGGPGTAAGADAGVLADAQRREVLDALALLPRRQQEVLVLRHYLDLSEAEIAETLGIRPGSVKTHASRGAAALRARLGTTRPGAAAPTAPREAR